MSGTAFVTGGSGFIGGRLIRRLISEGWTVRALARSAGSATVVSELGAEPMTGDLADTESIRAGADGAELAFHAAAHLGEWGPREDFMKGNVEGTRNTLAGCANAGVRRFVHVGTEAGLLTGKPLRNIDESYPLHPESKALYSATKAIAEQLVRDANRDGFETVVVRPRFVWGAGDANILPSFLDAIDKGRFAWVGGGRHMTSTTHVDNTVEGLVLGAERGKPGGVYFVTDGDPVVFREFITELIATQGVETPGMSIPAPIARAMAASSEGIWKTLRLKGTPPMTRLAYWLLAIDTTLDISHAREELGYEPIRSVADGMAELRATRSPPVSARP